MKQEYIRQVGRRLRLRRKQKTAVLRDLEEIFASAYEHGETEEQVIQRLGPPSEYAASVEGQLPSKGNGLLWAGLVVCLLVCLVSMGLFALARQLWVPEDAIGFAQGTTGIQVAGGLASPLCCWPWQALRWCWPCFSSGDWLAERRVSGEKESSCPGVGSRTGGPAL